MPLLGAVPVHDRPSRDGPDAVVAEARNAGRWFASHELRTPLQAIQGGVELLLEDGGRGLSTLQLDAVSMIAEAAANLERCVAQMAELAELVAAPPPQRERLTLQALLARPEIERHLSLVGRAPLEVDMPVAVAPGEAARALAQLAGSQEAGGGQRRLALAVEAATEGAVHLTLDLALSASGNGAIARRLAEELLLRAGLLVTSRGGDVLRLTLRQVSAATI